MFIYDISENKQQFISEYYANLSAINSMKQRYFKHYKVKNLWKNPYKLIMINFIVKNRINKLFFILKVKKRLGKLL